MANIANVTAFDGQSTPVSHTFVAESVSRDKDKDTITASYKEAAANVPDYAQGRLLVKREKLRSGTYRSSVRVELPVMEAVNGQNASGYTAPPKVAYVDVVEVVNYASPRSTLTGRRGARQLALNIAGSIGTAVTPVATGPAPELIDLLITPT